MPSGSGAKFVAQVTGNPAAAIHEVWITYTGAAGGTWASVDLQQCIGTPLPTICGTTADSQYWMGESASVPDKYIAQAANGVGLVTLDDNLGSYYSFGAAAPSATSVAFVGSVPGSVAYGINFAITAQLKTASGGPLPGKLVTIGVGASSRSGVTDGVGNVTLSVPALAAPASYPITALFGGDAANLPSAASSSIAITKAATTLSTCRSLVLRFVDGTQRSANFWSTEPWQVAAGGQFSARPSGLQSLLWRRGGRSVLNETRVVIHRLLPAPGFH